MMQVLRFQRMLAMRLLLVIALFLRMHEDPVVEQNFGALGMRQLSLLCLALLARRAWRTG